MEVVANSYLPGDQRLVDKIVYELKVQGIFDQFRKECFADVDTKPAYQNLRQRVEGSVAGFLKEQSWRPDMNKNQVREMLRKTITESGFLETGVERIVDQVVNPKISTVFLPKVEEVVYSYLGIKKPNKNEPVKSECDDLLPNDLEAVSPESEPVDKKDDKSTDTLQDMDETKTEEDESPPFEPLEEQSVYVPHEENSVDSHLSGFSGLVSHESNQSNENKITPMEQDSQLSRNSSDSRLSIVTSDENTKTEVPDDLMKISKAADSNNKAENDKSKQKTSDKYKSHEKSDKDKKSSNSRRDSKSRHSSSKDKEKSRDRKDSKSTSGSKSDKDKEREKSRDKNDKEKAKSSKHSSHSSSNSSSSSSSKDKTVKKESSRIEKSDKDKSRPSSSSHRPRDKSTDSKSKEKFAADKSLDKHKHSSSSQNDRHRKDKKREKPKDDHYSSRDKKNERRSTDRDSDGQSSKSFSSNSENHNTQSQKSSQGSGSGDSGNSDHTNHSTKAPVVITGVVEASEVIISTPNTQRVKVFKPKCASNMQEALRLRKIRKQLAKLEKQNQLSLTSVDVNSPILLSSSINLEDLTIDEKTKQENLNSEIVSQLEVVPVPLQNTVISQDNWDAMEAKLRAEVCSEFKGYSDDSLEESEKSEIEEDCKYFESVDVKEIEFLNFVEKFIKNAELKKKQFKGKVSKRKLEDNDLKNNNNNRHIPGKRAKSLRKNSERINNHSVNDKFSLPLSPAESEKSVGKKDDTVTHVKPKRNNVAKMSSQRYSSDDLYKPRATFASSRRRGAKNLEN